MDFHSLARKDLQTLCKKNKIPANKTNVVMADALQALQHVEGLEEFLNPSEFQNSQATEMSEIGSPEIPKTATRTSTRRKPIKAVEEPESSQTLTRTWRGTRRITEELDKENSQPPRTPAVPSGRKKAPAASARQRTSMEQCPVQHSYGTRRSARLSEKMGRTDPIHIEFSRALCKDLDGDEEESKGSDLQTISEERSTLTDDSEVVPDKKSDQSENDSKAEVEEITQVSARLDVTDSIKVSEATDEAHDDEENKEVLQKNTVLDCDKKAESIAEKGTDISSITMLITKNLNGGKKLEDEHQHKEFDLALDIAALPQVSDDRSCDSRKQPELSLTASGDGVVCKSPVRMDSEKNMASEGAEHDDDVDGQGGSEEFGMDFNQKTTADSGLDSDHSVSLDQSEVYIELESAKQGSTDFEDDVSPPSNYNQGDGLEFDNNNLNQKTTDTFSVELGTGFSVVAQSDAQVEHAKQGSMDFEDESSPPSNYNQGDVEEFDKELNKKTTEIFVGTDFSFADQSEAQIELELSKQGNMDFEDDVSPPSSYDQGESEEFDKALNQKTTDDFFSELDTDFFDADQSEAHVGLEFSEQGSMDFEDDAEEFDMDLNQKTTDPFSTELGADCSVVVDQSEAQLELDFAKDGSFDFRHITSSLSITDPKLETEERNINEINSVEPLPKEDKMSSVSATEEHAMADKFPPSSNNFPSPATIMSSPLFWVTDGIVSERTPLSPLAASLSTPTRKSSSNRPSALFSDNKENLDSGKKMMPKTEMWKMKKKSRDKAEDIMLKKLNDTSLRQLRKMFKEKLQIKENVHNEDMNDPKEVVKMRPALQTLPENRTDDDGTGKELLNK